MNVSTLILIGLTLIVTPGVLALRRGVEDDADMIAWIMEQTPQRLFLLGLMISTGTWLLLTGLLYGAIR